MSTTAFLDLNGHALRPCDVRYIGPIGTDLNTRGDPCFLVLLAGCSPVVLAYDSTVEANDARRRLMAALNGESAP